MPNQLRRNNHGKPCERTHARHFCYGLFENYIDKAGNIACEENT